jgi:hypothetical protein
VGNKENEYPVLDPSKTMINVSEELSNAPPCPKNPQRRNLGINC